MPPKMAKQQLRSPHQISGWYRNAQEKCEQFLGFNILLIAQGHLANVNQVI